MGVKLVVLFGKAGSGKDTILHYITSHYPDKFHEIVSCTTRPPREGEQEGVNYYFLTVEQFTAKILNGDMLEATEFNGWHYGTMLSSLFTDKVNIGVFNPAGIACILEDTDLDIDLYYIDASDKVRLIRQLNRERNPDVKEIIRRYQTDEEDFADIDDFNYIILPNETADDIKVCAKFIADRA